MASLLARVVTPRPLRWATPFLTWRAAGEAVHLTFDDGPHSELTPAILDVLGRHGATATFFCLGRNVERHPDLTAAMAEAGHAIGNHSHTHVDGWRTPSATYRADVDRCQAAIGHVLGRPTGLFRPPYGHVPPTMARRLRAEYEIVMWDVLSFDYEDGLDPATVAANVVDNATPGSIVLLHDGPEAAPRVLPALEAITAGLAARGLPMRALVDPAAP